MEYIEIFENSLNKLKYRYDLPKKGFLTGGSLANLIWEEVSGNKAEFSDIDIFILTKLDDLKRQTNEFKIKKYEKVAYETYSGLSYRYDCHTKYIIEKSSTKDIFNFIEYRSNTESPQIIVDSFDINCCQVGYDLEKEKFYWTPEFINFLKTGKLQITDLRTPSHTAIRLAKKSVQLNAKFDRIEFEMVKSVLSHHFLIDIDRIRFKEKYKNDYENYKDILSQDFELVRDIDEEVRIKHIYNIDDEIFKLNSIGDYEKKINKIGISTSKKLIYWIRNIHKTKIEYNWLKLNVLISSDIEVDKYFDIEVSIDKVNFINRLITYCPLVINKIVGYKLSEQINWIDTMFEKFKDKAVAISLLETYKLDKDVDFDDDISLMVLYLAVRKNISQENKWTYNQLLGKIDNIFNRIPLPPHSEQNHIDLVLRIQP